MRFNVGDLVMYHNTASPYILTEKDIPYGIVTEVRKHHSFLTYVVEWFETIAGGPHAYPARQLRLVTKQDGP
jgi:hypothetical protein